MTLQDELAKTHFYSPTKSANPINSSAGNYSHEALKAADSSGRKSRQLSLFDYFFEKTPTYSSGTGTKLGGTLRGSSGGSSDGSFGERQGVKRPLEDQADLEKDKGDKPPKSVTAEVKPDGTINMEAVKKEAEYKSMLSYVKKERAKFDSKKKDILDTDKNGKVKEFNRRYEDRLIINVLAFRQGDYERMLENSNKDNMTSLKKYSKYFGTIATEYSKFVIRKNQKETLISRLKKAYSLANKNKIPLKGIDSNEKLLKRSNDSIILETKAINEAIENAGKTKELEKEAKKYPGDTGAWLSYFKGDKMETLFNKAYTVAGAKEYWTDLTKKKKLGSVDAAVKKYKRSILAGVLEEHLEYFLAKNKKTGDYLEPLDKSIYRRKFMKLVKEARKLDNAGAKWRPLIFRLGLLDQTKYRTEFDDEEEEAEDTKENKAVVKADRIDSSITKLKEKHPNRKTGSDWRTKLMSLQEQYGISFHTANRHYIPNALMADESYKDPISRHRVLLGLWDYLPEYSNVSTAIYRSKRKPYEIKIAFKGTSRFFGSGGFKEIFMQDLLGIFIGLYSLGLVTKAVGSRTRVGKILEQVKTEEGMLEKKRLRGADFYKIKDGGRYFLEFNNRLYEFLKVYNDYKDKATFSFCGHSLGSRMAIMVAHASYLYLRGIGERSRPFNVSGFGTGSGLGQFIWSMEKSFGSLLSLTKNPASVKETIAKLKSSTGKRKFIPDGVSLAEKELARQRGTGYTEKSVPYKMYRTKGDLISLLTETKHLFFQKEVPQIYCSENKTVLGKLRGVKHSSKKVSGFLTDPHATLNFLPPVFWEKDDQQNVCS